MPQYTLCAQNLEKKRSSELKLSFSTLFSKALENKAPKAEDIEEEDDDVPGTDHEHISKLHLNKIADNM